MIYRAALNYPLFTQIIHQSTAVFPDGKGGAKQIASHDHLLPDYPGFIGGKTGYTNLAQETYVAMAQRDGKRLIADDDVRQRRPVGRGPRASGLGFQPALVMPGRELADSARHQLTATLRPDEKSEYRPVKGCRCNTPLLFPTVTRGRATNEVPFTATSGHDGYCQSWRLSS